MTKVVMRIRMMMMTMGEDGKTRMNRKFDTLIISDIYLHHQMA